MTGSKDYVQLVPRSQTRNEGVIKTLENMLKVARSEGLVGVAVAAVDAQGYSHTAFEPGENVSTLLGALQRVNLRLLEH